jgi:hypothetical protein
MDWRILVNFIPRFWFESVQFIGLAEAHTEKKYICLLFIVPEQLTNITRCSETTEIVASLNYSHIL